MSPIAVAVLFTLSSSLVATGCATTTRDPLLSEAVAEYRATNSHESLVRVATRLRKGMARREIERMLGKEPLCPVSYLCYYDSDKRELMEKDAAVTGDLLGTWVLGVSYSDAQGNETNRLQSWGFSLIAE